MILCKRFSANLQRCRAPVFIKIGKVYLELASIERRLDTFIDQSKKEDIKVADCGAEIDG